MIDADFWKGKRVALTGHTGFKGSWMAAWLQHMGAQVSGFSLQETADDALYNKLAVSSKIKDMRGDIADEKAVLGFMNQNQPDIVIHMAAQALVRDSYKTPVATFLTNVQGTVHVLEAVRQTKSVRAAVVVTSDKCYENKEWVWAYRENDRLGGHDPYSSSKACAEIVAQSYRKSFFYESESAALATARGGNVIGGGDMSVDRIVPDMVRAYLSGNYALQVRNPGATRPWQHVLDCLSGYLLLAQNLYMNGQDFADAWNFGPENESVKTVRDIVELFQQEYGAKLKVDLTPSESLHEAMVLTLDAGKAKRFLRWSPTLSFPETIAWTASWYRDVNNGSKSADQKTLAQIEDFMLRQAA